MSSLFRRIKKGNFDLGLTMTFSLMDYEKTEDFDIHSQSQLNLSTKTSVKLILFDEEAIDIQLDQCCSIDCGFHPYLSIVIP